jgi:hypothetical protein
VVGGDRAFVTSSNMHDVVPSPGVDSVVSSAMLVTGISKECISSTVIFGLHSMDRCIQAIEGTI